MYALRTKISRRAERVGAAAVAVEAAVSFCKKRSLLRDDKRVECESRKNHGDCSRGRCRVRLMAEGCCLVDRVVP
jgi:hypothetical protein